MDASYNDIQQWKYKDLVGVFGADPKKSKTYQVKAKQEAEDLFKDENFCSAPYLQVWGPRNSHISLSMLTRVVCRIVYAQRGRSQSAQIDCGGVGEDQCKGVKLECCKETNQRMVFMLLCAHDLE